MARLFYTLAHALDFLKKEIERNEAKLVKADGYGRMTLERLIEWLFERGISLISFSKPGEISPDLIDWFLGRLDKRPDVDKIEQRLKENEGKKK